MIEAARRSRESMHIGLLWSGLLENAADFWKDIPIG